MWMQRCRFGQISITLKIIIIRLKTVQLIYEAKYLELVCKRLSRYEWCGTVRNKPDSVSGNWVQV